MTIERMDNLGEKAEFKPSEIYGKQFKKSVVGGYRVQEVDDYLDQLATVFKELNAEIERLRAETTELRARNDDYRAEEASLRGALTSSQKLADEMIENARREAELILREAELQKARAQQEAAQLPTQLSVEVQALERQRDRLRNDLATVIETHRRMLDMAYPDALGRMPVTFFDVGPVEPALVDGPLAQETLAPDLGIQSKASDASVVNFMDEKGEKDA